MLSDQTWAEIERAFLDEDDPEGRRMGRLLLLLAAEALEHPGETSARLRAMAAKMTAPGAPASSPTR